MGDGDTEDKVIYCALVPVWGLPLAAPAAGSCPRPLPRSGLREEWIGKDSVGTSGSRRR